MTLKEARKRKSFTQKELASMVGVTRTTLSLIENCRTLPRKETKKRLEKIFGDDLEFYPASAFVEMINRFIGSDPKTAPQRGKFLIEHIKKVIQCVELDIVKFKPIKKP